MQNAPTVEKVLSVIPEEFREHIISIKMWGSQVYRSNTPDSDYDYIAVCSKDVVLAENNQQNAAYWNRSEPRALSKKEKACMCISRAFMRNDGLVLEEGLVNVTIVSASTWQRMLWEFRCEALETLWMDDMFILVAEPLRYQFVYDEELHRRCVEWECGRTWRKSQRKLREADIRKGWKEAFHAIRYYEFARQIRTQGRIVDYTAANGTLAALKEAALRDPIEFSDRFKPVFLAAQRRFRAAIRPHERTCKCAQFVSFSSRVKAMGRPMCFTAPAFITNAREFCWPLELEGQYPVLQLIRSGRLQESAYAFTWTVLLDDDPQEDQQQQQQPPTCFVSCPRLSCAAYESLGHLRGGHLVLQEEPAGCLRILARGQLPSYVHDGVLVTVTRDAHNQYHVFTDLGAGENVSPQCKLHRRSIKSAVLEVLCEDELPIQVATQQQCQSYVFYHPDMRHVTYQGAAARLDKINGEAGGGDQPLVKQRNPYHRHGATSEFFPAACVSVELGVIVDNMPCLTNTFLDEELLVAYCSPTVCPLLVPACWFPPFLLRAAARLSLLARKLADAGRSPARYEAWLRRLECPPPLRSLLRRVRPPWTSWHHAYSQMCQAIALGGAKPGALSAIHNFIF